MVTNVTGVVKPEVIGIQICTMHVCVSDEWTNDQILAFAEGRNPCGTPNGWSIYTDGPDPERVACADRVGCVHIILSW